MKTLVVFNIFIIVVFAKVPGELIDDWSAIAAVYSDECLSESGANSEIARKMFENHKLVNEEHIRCYFKCLMVKHNFMSEDGVLNEELLIKGIQHVTPEIAHTESKYWFEQLSGDKENILENVTSKANCPSDDGIEFEDQENIYDDTVMAETAKSEINLCGNVEEEMFPPLEIETTTEHVPTLFNTIKGRIVVNLAHLLNKYTKIINHSLSCTMGKMKIVKEVTFGLNSSLHFYCDNCEKTCVINSEPHNVGKDINKEIVWGCLSTGIGHNQAEEIFGLLDVPFMHTKTFAKKTSKVPYELIDDWNALAAVYADECLSESGANSEIARKMFENHKLVDEEHIRCYFKCLMIKYNFMSEDGVLNEDLLIKGVQHITPEIAHTCITRYGNEMEVCRKGYLVASCVAEENYET
ncbi:hypothetical protein RN001_007553 [Aquatica leii]|uniref:Mutator-like transposase domain-containing protein n=1 Tax=Aquatica leii TaxID=1421715 RepID=A0AAN7SFE8_9COLE|nr:hypothetical protein RN001_007553 [Aquatica leii]